MYTALYPKTPPSFDCWLLNECFSPQVILVFLQHMRRLRSLTMMIPWNALSPVIYSENSFFFQNWHKHLILNETLPDLPEPGCFFSLPRPPVSGLLFFCIALFISMSKALLHVNSLTAATALITLTSPTVQCPEYNKCLVNVFKWSVARINKKNVLHSQISNIIEVTGLFETFFFVLSDQSLHSESKRENVHCIINNQVE